MDAIEAYRQQAKLKTEFERVQLQKDKSGVRLEGLMAMNPFTQRPIPIFIADYVMITYGTGAIMAVPGHDQRDYDFAKKYDLPIIEVIQGGDLSQAAFTDIEQGILINSGFLNGLSVKQAIHTMIQHLESQNLGHEKIQYKMKDWAFNRQRYWGEPIPIIYCPTCGIQPVPYEDLPVRLPMVEHFQPTESGDSPLANIESFIHCSCPKCKGPARRETDTMPQWAGSSWYFLRYMDPKNPEVLASMDLLKYWGPIDWYNGGMEHVTRHLIYSRFWNHFLHDIGVVPFGEPYLKRTAQGLILGEDGEKMSKSRGNVVNPLEIISEYGADTLRAYILFIGDYEMATPWNENGLKGCRRFLDKIWRLIPKVVDRPEQSDAIETSVHKTIKGVNDDYENLKFNTAIAKMMTLVNEMGQLDHVRRHDFEVLLKLLNPIAPHLCEEVWEMLAHKTMLVAESWPTFDPEKLIEDQVEIVININGKVRDKMMLEVDADDARVTERALEREKVREWIQDKPIRKIIVVTNKLINIVI
jgi:leucyl-tRNA synthetase